MKLERSVLITHRKDTHMPARINQLAKCGVRCNHHGKNISTGQNELKEILAHPIMYMQDLGCMYGFVSTYEETIFLRQVVDNNGVRRVGYSPVVVSSTTYDGLMTTPVVSARQCFFYVGLNTLN